jgi:hypothetical protein
MFSRFVKPLSTRVIYVGPHANLSEEELAKTINKNKLMYNDANGEIKFLDYTFLDDIEEYATFGDFPASGDHAKMYLDQSQNRVYRWSGSQYFYMPHEVFSKAECNAQYYEKTDLYTKTETDNKYTIRGISNDLANTELNNIQTLGVLNCFTANGTSITLTKPIYAGWQNFDFVNAINNKLLLDGSNVRINSTLDLQGNNISNVNSIGSTESNTTYANSQFIYNTLSAFTNVLRVNEIQNGSNVPIISLGGDNAINCNGRNIIEIGTASILNTDTDTIRRRNGTLMMNFSADHAVDFNLKDIWKAGSIECTMLRRQNATEMLTLPNDSDISCNSKNLTNVASIQNTGELKFRLGKPGHINFHGQNLSGGVLSVRYIDGEKADPEGANTFGGGYLDLSGNQIKCQTALNLQNANIINITSTKTDFIDAKNNASRLALGSDIGCSATLNLNSNLIKNVDQIHDNVGLSLALSSSNITAYRQLNMNSNAIVNANGIASLAEITTPSISCSEYKHGGSTWALIGSDVALSRDINMQNNAISNVYSINGIHKTFLTYYYTTTSVSVNGLFVYNWNAPAGSVFCTAQIYNNDVLCLDAHSLIDSNCQIAMDTTAGRTIRLRATMRQI